MITSMNNPDKMINRGGWLLAIPGVLMARVAFLRARLPYNEEGRYVDEVQGVVYREEAAFVYGLIALLILLVSAGLLVFGAVRGKKRRATLSRSGPA